MFVFYSFLDIMDCSLETVNWSFSGKIIYPLHTTPIQTWSKKPLLSLLYTINEDLHWYMATHSFASGILDVRKVLNMGIRLGLGLGKDQSNVSTS